MTCYRWPNVAFYDRTIYKRVAGHRPTVPFHTNRGRSVVTSPATAVTTPAASVRVTADPIDTKNRRRVTNSEANGITLAADLPHLRGVLRATPVPTAGGAMKSR